MKRFSMDDMYYYRRFRKWMFVPASQMMDDIHREDYVKITFALEVFIEHRRPRVIPRIDRDYDDGYQIY